MPDLWSEVRQDVMRRLGEHAPGMPFEERVMVAEDVAREVKEMVTAFGFRSSGDPTTRNRP